MASVNKVILVGNLGRDPETKYMPDGAAITNVSIATSYQRTDKASGQKTEETEWHRVVFFSRLAEIAGEYLKKGSQVYVEGRLRTRNIRLAVVANRVRETMQAYPPLERFLAALALPLLGRIADSDVYVRAAEAGVSVFEMDSAASEAEREQFEPVTEWVELGREPPGHVGEAPVPVVTI